MDYEAYLRSAKWRNISAAMKKLADFTCQGCKTKLRSAELDVHHRNYDRLGRERQSDLEVLCRKCHQTADARRVEHVTLRQEQRASDACCCPLKIDQKTRVLLAEN